MEDKGQDINNAFFNQFLKPDRSYLPPYIREQLEISEIYTDFLLNFLMRKRKGIGKIDRLVLKKNDIKHSVKYFFEKESSIKLGYVDVIKKTDEYLILKINNTGIWKYNNYCVKYKIYVPTVFTRIRLWAIKLIQILITFIFVSVPKNIKTVMDSGIIKLILFLMAVLTLSLKWDEIIQLIHKLTEK